MAYFRFLHGYSVECGMIVAVFTSGEWFPFSTAPVLVFPSLAYPSVFLQEYTQNPEHIPALRAQSCCVISAGVKWLRWGRIHVYGFQPALKRNLWYRAMRRTSGKREAVTYPSHSVLPGGWGSQWAWFLS